MADSEESHDADTLRLDNQLCFALYAASHAVIGIYRAILDELGLTFPQYLVMLTLWEQDGQTITAIGRRLRLDSGTMTPLIKRLAEAGLIERRRVPGDERAVRICLTGRGTSLRPEAAEARARVICRLGMTDDEIRALRGQLISMIERVDGGLVTEEAG